MSSTLEAAERAVTELSSEELARFRQWFAEYDGEIWDLQIEADVTAGKLDALAKEALEDYRTGKATERGVLSDTHPSRSLSQPPQPAGQT